MRQKSIQHRFVDFVPDHPEDGVLYVSMEYGTVVHRCFCGCGEEVVTPLSPTDWTLSYNGESVSLWPSIGSWGLPCRSHYVIRDNRVRWAGVWSNDEIRAGRTRDSHLKASYYGTADPPLPQQSRETGSSWWRRLLGHRDSS